MEVDHCPTVVSLKYNWKLNEIDVVFQMIDVDEGCLTAVWLKHNWMFNEFMLYAGGCQRASMIEI